MKRIGLLGGSFNPAHRTHRSISINAARALGLDEVWWLVSPGNPLKDGNDMAPLPARLASARRMAAKAPIKPTALETSLHTVYTVDTLAKIVARYPRYRFIWLMGSDNLAQFPLWKNWRRIARTVPIAVVTRQGYDSAAHSGKAWAWLRRFVRPARHAPNWTQWSLPALVILRFRPDNASASAYRAVHPDWHLQSFQTRGT